MKLDVVGLVVRDMAASLGFYRVLGLEFPEGADAEGHVETTLAGGLRLAFDTVEIVRSFDEGWSAPSGSPRMSLAFRCQSPADVDARFAEMVGLGYDGHKDPWDAVWGMRYAVLHDPDENAVDLFADLGS